MEFVFAFRQQCAWYNDKEFFKLLVDRGIHSIKGPRDMSLFCRRQVAMDSASWCLFWENRHEFDHFLRWQADLIRHVIGWLTQAEEDEFRSKCDAVNVYMTSKSGKKSNHFFVSKALSGFLRPSKKKYLFNESGTVNLGSACTELDKSNPIRLRMTAQDVGALLLCNDKGRFKIEIVVNWSWKPFGNPPTQPWEIRIGANQGHSNQVIDPYAVHHPLTFEESMCLGWIFHVSCASNRRSIEQRGLLLNPGQGRGKDGRDSVHFMYHNDNSPGYVRMAEGTTAPSYYREPIFCVLLPHAAHDCQLFLSENGVVLIYDDVPARYLKIVDQLPTIASNVLRPGRCHMLSSTVTGGTWPSDITYQRVVKEKGVGFTP